MNKFALLLTLFSIHAAAADFRALDIGQPCATAIEWEASRGSTRVQGAAVPPNVYAFQAQEFGREFYVAYFCMNGALVTGNYSLPIESLERASNGYRDVHDKMLALYGDSSSDESPWNKDGTVQSTGMDSPMYVTRWQNSRTHTVLTLMRSKFANSPGWQVFIVIDSAQPEATPAHAP